MGGSEYDGGLVLVVDYSRADLLVIEEALKPLGLSLQLATSAGHALQALEEQDFAVALIDLCMPDEGGFELAEAIRSHPEMGDLPILFVTALEMTREDLRRAYSLGAVDVISKPIWPEVLRAKVSVFVDLDRKQRANQLLSELEELVLATAHDVQEPVRVTNQLLRELHASLMASQADQAREIMLSLRSEAQRTNRLVKGLMRFARLRLDPAGVKQVNLDAPLADAVQRVNRQLEDVEASVHFEALPKVRAHPEQLMALFRELLENSIKFRSERPLEVRIWAVSALGEVTCFVEDNGIGMPVQHVKRVFGLFQRHGADSDRAGPGLGLAIVQRIVHLNGGQVWCEPKPEGLRIAFTLPAGPPDAGEIEL